VYSYEIVLLPLWHGIVDYKGSEVTMKAISIFGMVVAVLFIVLAVNNEIREPDALFIDQAIYIVGGSLLLVISALLFFLHSMKDSIDQINSNLKLIRNQENPKKSQTKEVIPQSNPEPTSTVANHADKDFEGILRKPGEPDTDYWNRVDEELLSHQ